MRGTTAWTLIVLLLAVGCSGDGETTGPDTEPAPALEPAVEPLPEGWLLEEVTGSANGDTITLTVGLPPSWSRVRTEGEGLRVTAPGGLKGGLIPVHHTDAGDEQLLNEERGLGTFIHALMEDMVFEDQAPRISEVEVLPGGAQRVEAVVYTPDGPTAAIYWLKRMGGFNVVLTLGGPPARVHELRDELLQIQGQVRQK